MKNKILILLISVVSIFTYNTTHAQDIAGTWQGNLVVSPGNELVVQFIIDADASGTYSVVLNAPDSAAIKNVSANEVSFSDNKLLVDVVELSGKFEGEFSEGVIKGNWNQLGQAIPLVLTPFKDGPLSDEILQAYIGRWQGTLTIPGQTLDIIFNFEKTDEGKLSGTMESPDQGGNQFPVENIKATATNFKGDISAIRGHYSATLTEEGLQGEWSQGRSFPLNLIRKAADPREFALDLSADEKQLFMGTWHGEMTTPVGLVAAVFRFENAEEGFIRGYFDSPDRGAFGIALNEATLDGEAVTFAARSGSKFIGKLIDGKLVGDYSQQGQKFPVSLQKGSLPNLVVEVPNQLIGKWQGKLATPRGELTVVFRFENTDDGTVAFLDSPDQGLTGARIRTVSVEDDVLKLASGLIGMSYEGKIDNGIIQGNVSQGGQILELNLEK